MVQQEISPKPRPALCSPEQGGVGALRRPGHRSAMTLPTAPVQGEAAGPVIKDPQQRHTIVTRLSHGCRCVIVGNMVAKPPDIVKILVVDDEQDAVDLVAFNLKQAGFQVVAAHDGAEALDKVQKHQPDLIVLDVMMPELDGLEVCKLLRRDSATAGIPLLMLTAKASEVDRILGLELGADDYVTKPFSPRELVLRVRKLLARGKPQEARSERMVFGDLTIDIPRHLVSWKGQSLELTATEFKLLTTLAERRGRVQSRDQLLRDVWGYESMIDTRTVDTHMRRLREKLGPAARHLDTVRGVGYRFVDQ